MKRFVLGLLLALTTHVLANPLDQTMSSSVTVEDAWARATFPMATTAAAYFTIVNRSDRPITLTEVLVDESVADTVELHEVIMRDDMMRMQALDAGLTLSGDSMDKFMPGGKHLMLKGLTKGLQADEEFYAQFVFADSSIVKVKFVVKDAREHH